MLEITEKQFLSFDKVNRARILKYIILGLVKYKSENTISENEMLKENENHIPRLD